MHNTTGLRRLETIQPNVTTHLNGLRKNTWSTKLLLVATASTCRQSTRQFNLVNHKFPSLYGICFVALRVFMGTVQRLVVVGVLTFLNLCFRYFTGHFILTQVECGFYFFLNRHFYYSLERRQVKDYNGEILVKNL
jgi:hypothetical protein